MVPAPLNHIADVYLDTWALLYYIVYLYIMAVKSGQMGAI